MKVAYHLNPDDAPAELDKRLGWLIDNGDRIAGEMVGTMRDNAGGHALAVTLFDTHIEIVPVQNIGAFYLPGQTARLVVVVEIDTDYEGA